MNFGVVANAQALGDLEALKLLLRLFPTRFLTQCNGPTITVVFRLAFD